MTRLSFRSLLFSAFALLLISTEHLAFGQEAVSEAVIVNVNPVDSTITVRIDGRESRLAVSSGTIIRAGDKDTSIATLEGGQIVKIVYDGPRRTVSAIAVLSGIQKPLKWRSLRS